MTDPSPDDDSPFGFELVALYVAHFFTSLAAVTLNAILLTLLRQYEVYHANFRTIVWHLVLCLMLNDLLQMMRPLVVILQRIMLETGNELTSEVTTSCPDLDVFPAHFCFFVGFCGIVLSIERLYATLNYSSYENEDLSWLLRRIFCLMWFLFGVSGTWRLLTVAWSLAQVDYLRCSVDQIDTTLLKSSWHLFLALLTQALFCVIFVSVLQLNKEKKVWHIKNSYSLGPRYQIMDNIKTTQVLVAFTTLLLIAFGAALGHKWLQLKYFSVDTATEKSVLLWQELGLLIFPLFTSLMAAVMIMRSSVLYSKAGMLVKDTLLRFRVFGPGRYRKVRVDEVA
ncbi:Protein Y41D4B.1 [Aphelenchoides avenae]|nr:Protein Y41D4B.1 [Aphelenchus avenae]